MIKLMLLSLTLILLHSFQDVRVATYSTGKISTKEYEGLSFWVKDEKRAYIRYAHGENTEDLDLTYLGPDSVNGEIGFKARFPAPDSTCFFITPSGYALKVQDMSGKYLKWYAWEDERRSGDSTVDCSICPLDVKDAMRMMRTYFFR